MVKENHSNSYDLLQIKNFAIALAIAFTKQKKSEEVNSYENKSN